MKTYECEEAISFSISRDGVREDNSSFNSHSDEGGSTPAHHWSRHIDRSLKSSMKTCSHSPTMRKSVQFSSTEVRIYPQVLGDNPCCSNGLPLALSWEYTSEYTVPIDEYGYERHERRVLRLDACRRKEILQLSFIQVKETEIITKLRNESAKSTRTLSIQQYSEEELKRAERRLFRERQRDRTRSSKRTARRFFETPAE